MRTATYGQKTTYVKLSGNRIQVIWACNSRSVLNPVLEKDEKMLIHFASKNVKLSTPTPPCSIQRKTLERTTSRICTVTLRLNWSTRLICFMSPEDVAYEHGVQALTGR